MTNRVGGFGGMTMGFLDQIGGVLQQYANGAPAGATREQAQGHYDQIASAVPLNVGLASGPRQQVMNSTHRAGGGPEMLSHHVAICRAAPAFAVEPVTGARSPRVTFKMQRSRMSRGNRFRSGRRGRPLLAQSFGQSRSSRSDMGRGFRSRLDVGPARTTQGQPPGISRNRTSTPVWS
jgi:hypothetical protein